MEQAPELRDIVLRFYQAVSDGNIDAIDEFTSRRSPMLFIGTDPEEWWEDSQSIREMLRAQAAAGVTVIPGEVVAYREGSVGWIADRGSFRLPDGAEVPFRLTAVFHQEDGGWRMVQEHASIGIPNTEAIGQDFTI